MGVRVCLSILPERIDPADWRAYYDQVRRVWTHWEHPLLALRRETVPAGRRLVYSRNIEWDEEPDGPWLRVVGDLASLQCAEDFELRADLEHYRGAGSAAGVGDLLGIRPDEVRGGRTVFAEKTQGPPYHLAVLAAAMLAEARFPDAALVEGDIDRAQCEEAAAALQQRLGESVPLPILVDGERLYARLVGATATPEALQAFSRRAPNGLLEPLRIMRRRAPRECVLAWLAGALAEAAQPRPTLGATWLCQHWLNSDGDLDDLIEAAAIRPEGPRLPPVELAELLVRTGVSLPAERVDGLAVFDRPAGLPDSVASQFGNAMLDMMGMAARNCRYRIGAQALAARLGEHFPDSAGELADAVTGATAATLQALEGLGRWATQAQSRAVEDGDAGDGESFFRRADGDPLTPHQEIILAALAKGLAGQLQGMGDERRAAVGDGPLAQHGLLLRLAEERGPCLTEAGWAWLDAETDPDLLDLMIALLLNSDNLLQWVNLRRGLFEHRDLALRLLGLVKEAESR